jgi:hypothetical protein
MLSSMDQFSLAAHLFYAHGGVPEVAWDIAGELLAEGMDPREAFVKVGDFGSRIHRATEALANRST